MKKWKIVKKISIAIISIFLVYCIGCSKLFKVKTISQIYLNDILLLEQYLNYAWGYQNSVRYLDRYGYVYEYSFSDEIRDPLMEYKIKSEEDYLKTVLNESYYSGRPIGKIDEKKLKKILEELCYVNMGASKTEKHTRYDAGQHTLYLVANDTLLELHSHGDYEKELQDSEAKKTTKIWDKLELVQCDEEECISKLEQAKVKNGLSDQVGGVVTITETKNFQFKDGELTFRVLGLDNEKIRLEDVSVETTGNMKVEVEKAEDNLLTMNIRLTDTSQDIESITLYNFKVASYQLVPEIEYTLLIQGDGLINYGRDNIGIPDFINLREEDDYLTYEDRDISMDGVNVEGCKHGMEGPGQLNSIIRHYFIRGEEGELLIALDLIEQAYGLTGDKVKKEGDHVQLILGNMLSIRKDNRASSPGLYDY